MSHDRWHNHYASVDGSLGLTRGCLYMHPVSGINDSFITRCLESAFFNASRCCLMYCLCLCTAAPCLQNKQSNKSWKQRGDMQAEDVTCRRFRKVLLIREKEETHWWQGSVQLGSQGVSCIATQECTACMRSHVHTHRYSYKHTHTHTHSQVQI